MWEQDLLSDKKAHLSGTCPSLEKLDVQITQISLPLLALPQGNT